jgi:hypothetical protein
MKRAVVVVTWTVAVLLSVVLAVGCGGGSDPFVGTWNGAPDSPDYWVISKAGDTYSVTGYITTFAHAERQGDKLTFWTEPDAQFGGKPRIKMTVTSTGSDQLMLTDAYGPGVHIPLHKVSNSTKTPSPFYGHESPAASP